MLSKTSRLNLRYDFKRVTSGKNLDTKYLKLFIKKSSDLEKAKVGIALSSKNFPKAHDRNRAKRLVSAAFEKIYQSLPPTMEIVALPKPPIVDVKSDEVFEDLKKVLRDELRNN